MSEQFKPGDTVSWTSQAGGRTRTKLGEIVLVVPKGTHPLNAAIPAGVTLNESFLRKAGVIRKEESYIVRAKIVGSGGLTKRRSDLYWPLVRHLKLVPKTIRSAPMERI